MKEDIQCCPGKLDSGVMHFFITYLKFDYNVGYEYIMRSIR